MPHYTRELGWELQRFVQSFTFVNTLGSLGAVCGFNCRLIHFSLLRLFRTLNCSCLHRNGRPAERACEGSGARGQGCPPEPPSPRLISCLQPLSDSFWMDSVIFIQTFQRLFSGSIPCPLAGLKALSFGGGAHRFAERTCPFLWGCGCLCALLAGNRDF